MDKALYLVTYHIGCDHCSKLLPVSLPEADNFGGGRELF